MGQTNTATATTQLSRTNAGTSGFGLLVTNSNGFAIYALATADPGIRGDSDLGTGLAGNSASGIGLIGNSTSGFGVYGLTSSDGAGVRGGGGSGAGVAANSTSGTGLFASSGSGTAVLGSSTTGTAGQFFGPVFISGNFTATGIKSAAVPHPDGSLRRLYCLESTESYFEDFGEAQLHNGRADVTLDADFAALVHPEGTRYS